MRIIKNFNSKNFRGSKKEKFTTRDEKLPVENEGELRVKRGYENKIRAQDKSSHKHVKDS